MKAYPLQQHLPAASHRCLAALLAASLTQLAPAATKPGILWDRSRFDTRYADVHAAATNGSRIVTVGVGGVIRHSDDDGMTWNSPDPDVHYDLEDVIWDGARFIAVGGFGFKNGIVLTSADGTDWQRHCLGSSQLLRCVCSSGSLIATMGNNGRCFTTADTTSWSFTPTGIVDDYYDCTWTGSQFVRVGDDGLIETSPDATTWTPQVSGTAELIHAIAWNGSLLVAVGYDGGAGASLVLTSPDGVAWTKLNMSAVSGGRLRDVTWTGSRFVTCGRGSQILTSPDGTAGSWSSHSAGNGSVIYGLLWTGSHLFAVGDDGLILKTSEAAPDDPGDWATSATQEAQATFNGYAQHPSTGRIVAVGSSGTIAYSDDDGITGTDVGGFISSSITDITVTDLTSKRFVAVSNDGTIVSSSNGSAWDIEGAPSPNPLYGVAWAEFAAAGVPARVLAVGRDGTLVIGEDTTGTWGWTTGFIDPTVTFRAVAHGKLSIGTNDSLAVAVGNGGAIYTSPDGLGWTLRNSGTSEPLYDVVYADIDNGGFLAVAGHGVILHSKDGINWDKTATGDGEYLYSATDTGSQFVTVGQSGVIYTSPDGGSWTRRYGETSGDLYALLSSNTGRLLTGGDNGVVMYSDPAPDFSDWIAAQSPPAGMDDPDDDPNGDGIDNLASYAHGIPAVDPPTPDDLLRLLRLLDPTPGQRVRLRLDTNESNIPDVIYTLAKSQTLEPGSWTEVFRHHPGQECGSGAIHILPETGGFAEIELPETIGTVPEEFYRLGFELIH